MGQYITAALIGSLITIIIQAVINAISDIEKKHKSMETVYSMNKLFNIIANISDKISEVDPSDFESQFYQALQDERVNSAHQLADVIGGLINLITEIEQKLRKEYSDYLK